MQPTTGERESRRWDLVPLRLVTQSGMSTRRELVAGVSVGRAVHSMSLEA